MRRRETTHAAESGYVVTHTACGRDLNPSAGAYGSHSARPTLSSAPTCKACRAALRKKSGTALGTVVY